MARASTPLLARAVDLAPAGDDDGRPAVLDVDALYEPLLDESVDDGTHGLRPTAKAAVLGDAALGERAAALDGAERIAAAELVFRGVGASRYLRGMTRSARS